MPLASLTALSTGFIALSGMSVLVGWYLIRARRNMTWHRNTMLLATTFAALFLVTYVTRWATYGSKPFEGTGAWRIVYFANLAPHIVLALALGPLVARLLYLALHTRDFAAHRRLARVTLPIWLYVAASGWLVYYMLYRMTF